MNIWQTNSPKDLQDMGQYFRGLLIVMASDGHLFEAEQVRVTRFGLACGFSEKFIKENIENVLTNRYIPSVPPRFHSMKTAKRFILEAAEVAVCDGELHPNEQKWIYEVARENDISENEIKTVIDSAMSEFINSKE